MEARDEEQMFKGYSSEEEVAKSDKDGDYFPEFKGGRRPTEALVDSETKLKYLMDQIDTLTHSLNNYSQRVSFT
jgi:hypothetical protein